MVTIYFFYGLAFFTLGLALLVREVPSGIASLRPALKWFAAFALLHAAHEWLIMAQLSGLAETSGIVDLAVSLTGGISFAALLAAGLLSFPAPLRPPPRIAYSLLAFLVSAWALALLAETVTGSQLLPAEILARCLLGGPGGVLLGAGLFLQARNRLRGSKAGTCEQREASPFALGFFGAGFAVAGYGLLTFPGPFFDVFPFSIINGDSFAALFGLPIQVARALLAGLATVSMVAILKAFHEIDLEDLERQVTERTETLNEMAKHLSEALVNEERANQAKSEFLATMSHELRTPLNAIMGFSEIMRLRDAAAADDKRLKAYAGHIHDSGKHLLSLIDDVLQFSAIEAGQLQLAKRPTQIGEILHDCLATLGPAAAGKSIDLTAEVAESLPPANADSRAMRQILLNVLSNAIKFTPPGGRVRASLTAADGEIVMQVDDNGRGIAADKVAGVTEPFTRSHDNPYQTQDGIGLGLSIVKSLVEAHDGRLTIDSELGRGTTVVIGIPLGEARALGAAAGS